MKSNANRGSDSQADMKDMPTIKLKQLNELSQKIVYRGF